MKRFGSFGNAAAVVALGALVAAAVAAASAQAAPSKKNFTVQVAVTNAANPNDFTVTIRNDGSSNTTMGSVNVTLPTGFTASSATPSLAGWVTQSSIVTAGDGTSTLLLRSASAGDALTPGGVPLTVAVHVSSPATLPTICGNASWTASAKQSNDYNGTNNWFTLLTAKSDMTPLGSFEIADIGTAIAVDPFFTPAILLQKYTSSTVAYDTCHNVKSNYTGATLTHHGLTDATISPATSLSWTSGTGKVDITPKYSETNNTITVTDGTTGITDTSNFFDTQQKICTLADATDCAWQNNNGSIKANASKPTTGSLGVGFDPVANVTWDCGGNPLGNTVITIAPHDVGGADYQVTITYAKSVSGTGNANSFAVCESIDNGATFQQLQACSTYPTPVPPDQLPDCVVDQKRVTGGALQIILNLDPHDPYVGGK